MVHVRVYAQAVCTIALPSLPGLGRRRAGRRGGGGWVVQWLPRLPSPQAPQPTHVCSTELEFEVLILPANMRVPFSSSDASCSLVCGRKVVKRCS
jgi:hypothetical protein